MSAKHARLIGPLLGFNLAEEASRLRAESAYVDGDRNARTLVKAGGFFDWFSSRSVLARPSMRTTNEARWPSRSSEGRLALRVAADGIEVGDGEVAVGQAMSSAPTRGR